MIARFILLFLPILVLSQNSYRVVYEARQEFDRTNMKDNLPQLNEILNNSENLRFEYELLVTSKTSFFKKIDKINNSQKSGGITLGISSAVGSNVFKDFNKGLFYEEKVMDAKTFVQDSLQQFPWQIIEEEKEILGYIVKKAIYSNTNQTVEAWFAPQLAFQDGPTKFNGLPGLILEIKFLMPFASDMDTYIIYKAINIKENKLKIELPKNTKIISKEENQKELEKYKLRLPNTGIDKD